MLNKFISVLIETFVVFKLCCRVLYSFQNNISKRAPQLVNAFIQHDQMHQSYIVTSILSNQKDMQHNCNTLPHIDYVLNLIEHSNKDLRDILFLCSLKCSYCTMSEWILYFAPNVQNTFLFLLTFVKTKTEKRLKTFATHQVGEDNKISG